MPALASLKKNVSAVQPVLCRFLFLRWKQHMERPGWSPSTQANGKGSSPRDLGAHAVRPWASHLTSPGLSFLIFEKKQINKNLRRLYGGDFKALSIPYPTSSPNQAMPLQKLCWEVVWLHLCFPSPDRSSVLFLVLDMYMAFHAETNQLLLEIIFSLDWYVSTLSLFLLCLYLFLFSSPTFINVGISHCCISFSWKLILYLI